MTLLERNENTLNNGRQFSTTRWSVIRLAGGSVSPESAAALEKLCRAYWPPIYYFARRKGWNDADAQDLTQQFFAQLLARNDFGGVDPTKANSARSCWRPSPIFWPMNMTASAPRNAAAASPFSPWMPCPWKRRASWSPPATSPRAHNTTGVGPKPSWKPPATVGGRNASERETGRF